MFSPYLTYLSQKHIFTLLVIATITIHQGTMGNMMSEKTDTEQTSVTINFREMKNKLGLWLSLCGDFT